MNRTFGILLAVVVLVTACGGEDRETVTKSPASDIAPETAGQSRFPSSFGAVWKTDFSKASVSPDDLVQGQIKDGIPAISKPNFLGVPEVDFLKDREPVVAFQAENDVRAYPLQILIWHEIVNDVVGGRPVLITFCPLCNTAIAFDRVVHGEALEFGVSGFLRNSDLVMFDRLTESWWQQVTGEAIVGELTGTRLELLPSSIVSWADFRAAFPEGRVLSTETGYKRQYGVNPYVGYDDISSSPFLFDKPSDPRLAAMERVVTVEIDGDIAAYPFSRLALQPVVYDTVGGGEIVVLFKRGTASALDRNTIADSRDIGAAAVFRPVVDGKRLSFSAEGSVFIDSETGSRWDIFGRATTGPFKGKVLEPVVSGNDFWFAWAAFKPQTRIWHP